MDNENNKKNGVNKTYIAFAIIFVLALALLGIASSYAYYKLNVESSNSKTNVVVETDCIDISFEDQTDSETGLTYNYPITDTFALSDEGVKPITLKVKNKCTNNTGKVPYVLTLASIQNGESTLEDSKVRYHVKKQKTGEIETELISANYLSTATKLTEGTQAYTLLKGELANNNRLVGNTTPYIIDTGELDNEDEITYKIYLWVDYYEGDSQMYQEGTHTHDSDYDNSTKNKTFKTISSILINTSINPIEGQAEDNSLDS